ncbi:MAG: hypothetical protein HY001_03040 [Candidatus Portnoybacteria bacterium]|nr:hypothetical protein [Candidatus Portnoybacteria bacterium]
MSPFSKNFLFGALIAILLITTIIFGALWMQGRKEVRIKNQEVSELQKQVQELQSKLTEQKPQTPPKTQQPQDTSNWKTYRNEQYGFEIKYPKPFTVKESRPVNSLSEFIVQIEGLPNQLCIYGTEGILIDVSDLLPDKPGDLLFSEWVKGGINKQFFLKPVLINGISGYQRNPSGLGSFEVYYLNFDKHHDKYFTVHTLCTKTLSREEDQILSTFKFIQ